MKAASSREFFDVTTAVMERARACHAQVIVNDRADIAQLSGATGVHVGQEDLDALSVRRMLGEAAVVGLSTHTADQLRSAIGQPVSYVATGPVFGTATKDTGYPAVGLDSVRRAAAVAHPKGIAVVAIGGITLQRAASVMDAGADAVAVISDLLITGNPAARVREFLGTMPSRASG